MSEFLMNLQREQNEKNKEFKDNSQIIDLLEQIRILKTNYLHILKMNFSKYSFELY